MPGSLSERFVLVPYNSVVTLPHYRWCSESQVSQARIAELIHTQSSVQTNYAIISEQEAVCKEDDLISTCWSVDCATGDVKAYVVPQLIV